MGDIANDHVNNFLSGRWGTPIPKHPELPTISRSAIAHMRFKIVEVVGGKTNRFPGTKLVVCEQNAAAYWVWASSKVTGIAKAVCRDVTEEMSLNEALRALGRRPYAVSAPAEQVSHDHAAELCESEEFGRPVG